MKTIGVQPRTITLISHIVGFLFFSSLLILVEFLLMISPEINPPLPAWARLILYAIIGAMLVVGLWEIHHKLRIRRMTLELEGIRPSPDAAVFPWSEVASCEEESKLLGSTLYVNLSNDQQIIFSTFDVR